jgi:transposase
MVVFWQNLSQEVFHEEVEVHRAAFALRQAETGTRVAEVCRIMGISENTYYRWKKEYGELGVCEHRRLRQLQ